MSSIGNKEIDARYITKKLLKTNAKSSVYLVTDKVLSRDLVIKKGRKDFNNETNSLPREASIMVSLDHPNLPKIYDVKEDEDFIYTIEEFIDGEDLRTLVGNEGPLDQDTVIKWGITLCNIMEYLHSKGIIYRDMKPGNIMLTPTGNIKLIDFDTARNYKEGAGEDTTHLGTVGYAAPEQFETK
ncbi:MAG: serine/threonine protein kinase, partial [Lachnospiraceae bacterium]|nr:serine/threonine protein kinase [Lachnospiraceae bacterium]